MDKGKKITFSELFQRVERVEIPIIQRDYAQGREDQHEVRNMFLDALFTALTTNRAISDQSLDLDFIYGSVESDKSFSVLDGQQRLTTLFLLHWFLAVKESYTSEFRKQFTLNNKSRFSYKTRPSSTEFFDALTSDTDFEEKFNQSKSSNNSNNSNNSKISALISDCKWFFSSWKLDPTVQACLNMLDAIQDKFSSYDDGLYQRLTETKTPYITFQFLQLESFGLTDDLYIKMNARGKPLTAFEHFKAKLEQIIKSYKTDWPIYQLDIKGFNNTPADGYSYFVHKIDTDWADLFWPYRNLASEDNTYDDELMNFIRLIILYQYLLDNKEVSKDNLSLLMGSGSKLLPSTISQYESLNCLNQNLIIRLINLFDLLHNSDAGQGIRIYWGENKYFNESDIFKKILINDTSYIDKLRFFAFYSYLSKHSSDLDSDKLFHWSRVIYNLTENTIVDSTDDFHRALTSIESLIHTNDSILDILISPINITGFLGDQILEEKIKAHLILKSDDWKNTILHAENHPFFKGQIGCLLNFSDILEYYRNNNDCNWDTSQDNDLMDNFKKYDRSLGSVFNQISTSSAAIDYLWERATLTKGIYFTKKTWYDRYNLLSTRLFKNNINRDHSWKRLLRIGSETMETRQSHVKAVLDDANFDADNIRASLQNICDVALANNEFDKWREYLIRYPQIFEYCEQGFIEIHKIEANKIEVLLLSQSQRNHYHSELYTFVLKIQLKDKLKELLPFSDLKYQEVKSTHEQASLKITGWHYAGNDYSFETIKSPGNFIVRFKNDSSNDYPQKVADVLESNGFQLQHAPTQDKDTRDEYTDDETTHYENKSLTSVDDVISQLTRTCHSLRDLSHE